MKIAYVACHFNPAAFKAPVRNFKTFAAHFAPHGGVHIVELVLPGREQDLCPSLLGVNTYRRIDGGSVLWQKERLLNEAMAPLMASHDAICWLDGDVVFETFGHHLSRCVEAAFAGGCELIQLFRQSVRTTKRWTERFCEGHNDSFATYMSPSLVLATQEGRPEYVGDPGLAWGATTEWLHRAGGLFEAGILGGGDTFMVNATRHSFVPSFTTGFAEAYQAYQERVRDTKLGCANTTIFHLYHGSVERRRYSNRYDIARRHDYDPAKDIRVEVGAFAWASAKPAFHEEVANYFTERQEDA